MDEKEERDGEKEREGGRKRRREGKRDTLQDRMVCRRT